MTVSHFLIFACFLLPASLQAQSWADLYPSLGRTPELGPDVQREFDRAKHLLETRDFDALPPEDKERVARWEVFASIYDIEGEGCSWYCAGGPRAVRASSELPPQGQHTYRAQNAHDLSLRSAWVEGVDGQGTGEYLEYVFEPESPRITHIKVFNGYVKSENAWKANSRVKRLDVYVNGAPFARLHLQDTRAEQTFALPAPLGRRADGQELRLRFEIAAVYPGDRYEDTALTEIFFDGLDVHCLAEGTPIRLADGRDKPIEFLEPGDSLRCFERFGEEGVAVRLAKLEAYAHEAVQTLTFSDGRTLSATPAHPFLLSDGSWVSADPDQSRAFGYPVQRAYRRGDTFAARDAEGRPTAVKLVDIATESLRKTFFMLHLDSKTARLILANGILSGTGHYSPAE